MAAFGTGDLVKVNANAKQYGGKYNGWVGYIPEPIRYANIPVVFEGYGNPSSQKGYFYFRACDLESCPKNPFVVETVGKVKAGDNMVNEDIIYNVGDHVLIKGDKEGCTGWNTEGHMDKWHGTIMTIATVTEDYYEMEEDGGTWGWYPDMIERLIEQDTFKTLQGNKESGDMLYGVGDRLLIKDSRVGSYNWNVLGEMDEWQGQVMTVTRVGTSSYKMQEDGGRWCWFPDMIAHRIGENILKDEENDIMKTGNILNLWRDNEKAVNSEQAKAKIEAAKTADVNFIAITEAQVNLNNVMASCLGELDKSRFRPSVGVDDAFLKEETLAEIENVEKERDTVYGDIQAKYTEVSAALSACETYEQEIKVLYNYDIVNSNGVLENGVNKK